MSASAELLITVTGVNDAPVAVANTNEVPENGAIDLAAASSVLGDDADVDGDALTVSSIRTGNVAATDGAQGEIGSTLVGAYGVLNFKRGWPVPLRNDRECGRWSGGGRDGG